MVAHLPVFLGSVSLAMSSRIFILTKLTQLTHPLSIMTHHTRYRTNRTDAYTLYRCREPTTIASATEQQSGDSTAANATSTEGDNQREKQQASTAEPATGATTARQEIGTGEAAAASAGGGGRDAAADGAGATRQPAAATITNRAMAATTTDSLGPATESM